MLNCFMSRIYSPNIQLIAARCVTYIYRSGTLPSSDFRILHRALPCLVRLCSDDYKQPVRASAAETLAILIEVGLIEEDPLIRCWFLYSKYFDRSMLIYNRLPQFVIICWNHYTSLLKSMIRILNKRPLIVWHFWVQMMKQFVVK